MEASENSSNSRQPTWKHWFSQSAAQAHESNRSLQMVTSEECKYSCPNNKVPSYKPQKGTTIPSLKLCVEPDMKVMSPCIPIKSHKNLLPGFTT